jgi:hypothetical protein
MVCIAQREREREGGRERETERERECDQSVGTIRNIRDEEKVQNT